MRLLRHRHTGRLELKATNERLIILRTANIMQVFNIPITGTNAMETIKQASQAPNRSSPSTTPPVSEYALPFQYILFAKGNCAPTRQPAHPDRRKNKNENFREGFRFT